MEKKICIIGQNQMGGYTAQWYSDRGERKWFACRDLRACKKEAKKRGFTHYGMANANPGSRKLFRLKDI